MKKNIASILILSGFVFWAILMLLAGARHDDYRLLYLSVPFVLSMIPVLSRTILRKPGKLWFICLLATMVSFCDCAGSALLAAARRAMFQKDSRYRTFYYWVTKQKHIPYSYSDRVPGVYIPSTVYEMLNSEVTIGPDGFRREYKGRCLNLDQSQATRILCLGGSTMFGQTTDKGDKAPPDFLQQMLCERNIDAFVYNGSLPGGTVFFMNRLLIYRYKVVRPRVTIFCEAINTLAPGQMRAYQIRGSFILTLLGNYLSRKRCENSVKNYKPSEYAKGLIDFINISRSMGAIPIIVTYPLPYSTKDSPRTLAYWDAIQSAQGTAWASALLIEKHNAVAETIANEFKVPIIDTSLLCQPKYYIDQCHLTQEGSSILARLMMNKLSDLGLISKDAFESRSSALIIHGT